jgi:O-antigen/teichoic acid export membrane protein
VSHKSLKRDLIFVFSGKGAIFIVQPITAALIARALGPEGQGIYSALVAVGLLLTQFAGLGLDNSVVYFASHHPERVNQYVLRAIVGLSIAWLVLAAILWFSPFARMVWQTVDPLAILLALLLAYTGGIFNIFIYALTGLQRHDLAAVGNVIRLVLWLGFITPLFVWSRLTIHSGLLAWSASAIISTLFMVALMKPWQAISPSVLNWQSFRDEFAYSRGHYMALNVYLLYARMDLILITLLLGEANAGYYSIGKLFVEMALALPSIFSTWITVTIAVEARRASVQMFCRLLSTGLIVGCFAVAAAAPLLVRLLFSAAYQPSIVPLQIILVGSPCLSISFVLAHYLYGMGNTSARFQANAVGILTTVPLLFVLTPHFGLIGAALASALGYGATLLVIGARFQQQTGLSPASLIVLRRSDLRVLMEFVLQMLSRLNRRSLFRS